MDTEVTLSNQPRGIRLEFRVIAVNKAGEGAPSNGVLATFESGEQIIQPGRQ